MAKIPLHVREKIKNRRNFSAEAAGREALRSLGGAGATHRPNSPYNGLLGFIRYERDTVVG